MNVLFRILDITWCKVELTIVVEIGRECNLEVASTIWLCSRTRKYPFKPVHCHAAERYVSLKLMSKCRRLALDIISSLTFQLLTNLNVERTIGKRALTDLA